MKKLIAALLDRIAARFKKDPEDSHPFELRMGQRVSIVTDFGRGGVIQRRSASMYEGGTEAYFVKRDRDGASEWYPRFALATDGDIERAPTEINVQVKGAPPATGTII